jgi:hypothetical protein
MTDGLGMDGVDQAGRKQAGHPFRLAQALSWHKGYRRKFLRSSMALKNLMM